MRKYATILDIADRVGLSHMTVSRVLSGKPGVRQATRQRVLSAAKELSYSANSLANGFRRGRTRSAGIVWQFVDPWAGDAAVGLWVMQALQREGLATYQAQFSPVVEEMAAIVDDLAGRRVDAMVIGPVPEVVAHPEIRSRLERIPAVVYVGYGPIEDFRGDQIVHDRLPVIRQSVHHLAAIGRKRPAMLLSRDLQLSVDKHRVFCEAMVAEGIGTSHRTRIELPLAAPTLEAPFTSDTQRYEDALRRLWPASADVDVDAIVTLNDHGAMVVCNFLQSRGVRVPEQVAVIGFNDEPAAALWNPPLASGDRRRAVLAETTREMLLTRLANPELSPRRTTVEMRFIWRQSAGGSGEAIA